ncbi:microcin-processing peptidase 1. Unknown type peptidase. MEROPS family U62 [Loktanella fryxellensis]|uniref:PmbA protein n=1 Tax=Loktanella fryxellensis TaxID=245187 RepID=A0A1H8HU04_9RHOB|nr:TldD/PmbA family protein [Loktanella fryxellensis]SEN59501.1 microcin-processing peptidase 1. Unknown type peptidase. MEROPS family U62 [Loktanella fryxellensis]
MTDLADLTHRILDAARRAGAHDADAVAVQGTSIAIDVRQGQLEKAERSEGIDVGLRVLLGQRQACVSSSDSRPEALAAMAERAVAMAREAPADPTVGLAEAAQLAQVTDTTDLELYDPSPEPDPAALQDAALRAEAAALQNPGLSQVSETSAGYGRRQVHMAATNGFSGGYARSDIGLSCVAISGTGTGMERDYDYDSRIFQTDMRSPEEIGRTAAARAVERAGSRRPRTGAYPVLFDERIASSLIGHLVQAINGSAIARGASFLRDASGTQVLPAGMNLTEDPHRPRAFGSRRFDAEGLPTQTRAWVQDGVLTGWVLDLATGRKLGMPSTANASRGTGAPPSPSVTNLALTQGTASRDDLIAQMGTGLLVTSMIGSTINPNTGDYSRGAAGFWVQNGEIAYPVNECTIAGNLRDMWRGMIAANDARPHLSRVVPSLLVEGLTLAGD